MLPNLVNCGARTMSFAIVRYTMSRDLCRLVGCENAKISLHPTQNLFSSSAKYKSLRTRPSCQSHSSWHKMYLYEFCNLILHPVDFVQRGFSKPNKRKCIDIMKDSVQYRKASFKDFDDARTLFHDYVVLRFL